MKINIRSIEKKIVANKELNQDERVHLTKKTEDFYNQHPDVKFSHPRWKMFLSWVAGYQNHGYSKRRGTMVPIDNPTGKRRLVFNRLKVFVRKMLSKLSTNIHQAGVVPNTADNDDIDAAELGDQVCAGIYKKLKFRQLLRDLKLWLIIINRAYIRVFWNEEDHGTLGYRNRPEVDEDGEAILNDAGEPEETDEIEEITESGDIGVEVVSPFRCRSDSLHSDRKKWRWFVYADEVDAEALEEKYDLEPGSLQDVSNQLETPDMEMAEGGQIVLSPDRKDDVRGRTVWKYHLWTPKIYAFIAGGKILEKGVNKYKEIPFFEFEETIVPHQDAERKLTYNDSLVRTALPVQKDFNRTMSSISEALQKLAKPKILLPLNSVISRKSWTNDFATFIDVNTAQGKPEQMKLDPLPPFVQVYKQELEREMEHMWGIHEGNFGQLPKRASHASGTLVNILLEQDDETLVPMLQMIDDGLSGVWSFILRMVQDNYDASRLLKFVGEDGQELVRAFSGADLRGNTDVEVSSETGLPRSRALRTEFIVNLQKEGYLSHKQALQLMQLGNTQKMFKDQFVHEKRAMRENALIERNPEINPEETVKWVYPLEDHITHLPIHVATRVSVKYERWTDNQKQALDKHIEITIEIVKANMIQQAQAMTQGQAGAPETTTQEVSQ